MPANRRLRRLHRSRPIHRPLLVAVLIVGGLAGCASPWSAAEGTAPRPATVGHSSAPRLRPTQSYRSQPHGVMPTSYRAGTELPSYPQALHVPVTPQPTPQFAPQFAPQPTPLPEFDPTADYRSAPMMPGPMMPGPVMAAPMASPQAMQPEPDPMLSGGHVPFYGEPAAPCIRPRYGVMCGPMCGSGGAGGAGGCGAGCGQCGPGSSGGVLGGALGGACCLDGLCDGLPGGRGGRGTQKTLDWRAAGPIPWETHGPGEYVGPARAPHVAEYRLRVDDLLEFVYRLTGEVSVQPYRLNIGDHVRVEVLTDAKYNRDLIIQPDGMITVPQYGQVRAAGHTVAELRDELESVFTRALHLREPGVTVTPTKMNTTRDELRSTVDGRYGSGGQTRRARVTPEGTVQLPAVGSVYAQGLTLAELKEEIEHRYAGIVSGVEITPILAERAPRFVYVVGEVRAPGRFQLEGPTTTMQAISLAGSWNPGAKLESVVVLRRDADWNLMATRLNLRDAFFGRQPCPPDEIWLRDGDVVIIPKTQIQWTGDLIQLFFSRGIYGILPIGGSVSVGQLSVL